MNIIKYTSLICALFLAAPIAQTQQVQAEQRGDFWLDANLHFRLADGPLARIASPKPDQSVSSDYTHKNAGDCSVAINLAAAKSYKDPVILMTPGLYIPAWNLAKDWAFQFDISQEGGNPAARCTLTLVDATGKLAQGAPIALAASAKGAWQQVRQPLGALTIPSGFDFSKITRAALKLEGGSPATVGLDAVRFTTTGKEIALTDQLTSQRMADERATRAARITEVMEVAAQPDKSKDDMFYFGGTSENKKPRIELQRLFANLYLNRDVKETNRKILELYTSKDVAVTAELGLEYDWGLSTTPNLCRFLFTFGSKSKRFPGRLTPEVEKVLLDWLWIRTVHKNDITVARGSTWNLTGSENHDINAKVANVLASQIFMNEPEYKDRIFPNRGTGLGYTYWFHRSKATGRFRGPEGTGPVNYPGDFRAADQYREWVRFMKEFIVERSKRGFFVEKASPGYMNYTMSFIYDLYDYTTDPELKQLAGMFLDLIWAEWAQDQVAGMRGGSKTRDSGTTQEFRGDTFFNMAHFIFGGPARHSIVRNSFWMTDHRPPAVVWNLVMNRAPLGAFAYISRTPGEEIPVSPRPPGNERTLMLDTDSRLLRYSWVTPDYIMGTQMDHPLALHSHLSTTKRFQGIIFPTNTRAIVQTRDLVQRPNGSWGLGTTGMYRSLQHGPVMITQQPRRLFIVSPEWFPAQGYQTHVYGVGFAANLSKVEDEGGWVFVEEGNAYLAVRVVAGQYQAPSAEDQEDDDDTVTPGAYQGNDSLTEPLSDKAATWVMPKRILRCNDRHSPIIFEAGRRADYPTLAEFKKHILGNSLVLHKTAIPGWYTLTYKSNGVEYYFNATAPEAPKVNGVSVNYEHPRIFDSPWMQAGYRHGIVRLNDGVNKLTLDFLKGERRAE